MQNRDKNAYMNEKLNESPLSSIYKYQYRIDKKLIAKIATTRDSLARFDAKIDELPDYGATFLTILPHKEAKESSEIENIFTTSNELFQLDDNKLSPSAKEAKNYFNAIISAWDEISKNKPITLNLIKTINSSIHSKTPDFRTLSGTKIMGEHDNIVHVPPQSKETITTYMDELEKYINDETLEDDPIVLMALIHYQFEKIHPFYDGNGRTGRILNILVLIQKKLISTPVLYLSSYIIKRKHDYYSLLEKTISSEQTDFYDWITFFLDITKQASDDAMTKVYFIKDTIDQVYKDFIKAHPSVKRPKDLINHVFAHPITTINNFMEKSEMKDRRTASKQLDALVQEGFLTKDISSKTIYYTNQKLLEIFDM